MTPNFALSLSFDGIRLLHATSEGWQLVDDVGLDAADLGAEMAALRGKAAALEPGDIRTKLLLPADQIKFLTIDTARTSEADIHAAIDAETPLELSEMVIDFDRSGGRTYIAAVAQQTLKEAEDFARDHGFAPVCFAAVPEPLTFQGEIFFGPTAYATDVLGGADALCRAAEPAVETVPAKQQSAAEAEPVFARREREAPPEAPQIDKPKAAEAKADEPKVDELKAGEPQTGEKDTSDTALTAPPPSDMPIAQFTRSASADETPDAAPDALPIRAAGPVQSRRRSRVLTQSEDASGLLDQLSETTSARAATASTLTPPTQVEAALAARARSEAQTDKPNYVGIAGIIAAVVLLLFAAIWAGGRINDGITAMFDRNGTLPEEEASAPVIVPDAAVAETAPEDAPTPTPDIAALPAPDAQPAPDAPQQPIVTAVPGRVLSPADAARIYAATGVWQKAPRLHDTADEGTLDGLFDFATLATPERGATLSRPDLSNPTPDLRLIRQPNPAPFNRPQPRDENGFIIASPSGTLLPTGVIIYGRAPAKEPLRRPTDEPVGLDDDSIPTLVSGIAPFAAEATATANLSDAPVLASDPAVRLMALPTLAQPAATVPVGLANAAAVAALPPAAETIRPAVDFAALIGAEMTTALGEITAPEDYDSAPITSFVFAGPATLPSLLAPDAPAADAPVTASAFVSAPPPSEARAVAENAAPEVPALPQNDTLFVEVIFGRPAIAPPLRPGTPVIAPAPDVSDVPDVETPAENAVEAPEAAPEEEAEAPTVFQDPQLVGFRPAARPAGLAPEGIDIFEAIPSLGGSRPLLRPASLVLEPEPEPTPEPETTITTPETDIATLVASIAAAAPPSAIRNPTASAIAVSPRPSPRPRNFATVVASATALATRQADRNTAASTSAAVVAAPRTAPTSSGSTTPSVARAATVDNAINLRNMNLIGVYGKPGARRALIRLSNGRFVKVEVGSNLDGGRVTAIGDNALNFVKRGQTYALQLPAG